MTGYNGSPWRSRFLRGPKLGLDLANRDDFVELGTISTVKLGLKSGNDPFFFLSSTGQKARGARVRVVGLGGWTGDIPRTDLLPAAQSPKDLDRQGGRLAVIPMNRNGQYAGDSFYFFPRSGRLDAAVREYIEYGEARSVNEGALVAANAGSSGWYRQARTLVRSPWALPYNSGYDYGAVGNPVKAVLNGRFVGVAPGDSIDSDVLGGILNSTFVTLMRLLEGVATGNEGAFDVGPPAARLMSVPDPSRMSEAGQVAVADAMRAVVSSGYLPPAPLANGQVDSLRRILDLAVLVALGMSRGEAAAYLDRIYESYGRWRAAVAGLEDQMQEHRRALAQRGGSRAQNPAVRAARIVWDEMEPVTPILLADITFGQFELVDLRFTGTDEDDAQEALFPNTVVLNHDRKPVNLGHPRRVDMARFVRSVQSTGDFPLPISPGRCGRLLDEAKRAVAEFETEAFQRAKTHVSDDLVDQVVATVKRLWLNKSIGAMRMAAVPVIPSVEDQEAEISTPELSLFDAEGIVPPIPLSAYASLRPWPCVPRCAGIRWRG